MSAREVYVSVDVEANGPIPGEFSMIAVGACVVGEPSESFYAELKPLHERFDPRALAVSGLSMERLLNSGEDPETAMRRFADWAKRIAGPKRQPVFVAFNATFDWMFVHWYFIRFTGSNPFGISGLDLKAYFMGLTGCDWRGTRKHRVQEKFPSGLPHTHHALEDAREQAAIFEKMLAARPPAGPPS